MKLKTCCRCKVQQSRLNFVFTNAKRGTGSRFCKSCDPRIFRDKDGRATCRETNLIRNYGITVAEYDKIFEAQGGVCKICFQPQLKKRLAVDHCHKTGIVRGLLCDGCNRGIGLLKDSSRLLFLAARYISEFES